MNIYLSGASSELPLCQIYMQKLELAGHKITCDWTKPVAEAKAGRVFSQKELEEAARDDLLAVAEADVFWLLVPKVNKASIGCWVELGFAINEVWQEYSTCNLLVVSGEIEPTNIFPLLVVERFPEHEEAFEFIVKECASKEAARRK